MKDASLLILFKFYQFHLCCKLEESDRAFLIHFLEGASLQGELSAYKMVVAVTDLGM